LCEQVQGGPLLLGGPPGASQGCHLAPPGQATLLLLLVVVVVVVFTACSTTRLLLLLHLAVCCCSGQPSLCLRSFRQHCSIRWWRWQAPSCSSSPAAYA
jgi:hypothetical protein